VVAAVHDTATSGFSWSRGLAIAAAILTGLVTFLKASAKASQYLQASDLIGSALMARLANDPAMTDLALKRVVDEADRIVRP